MDKSELTQWRPIGDGQAYPQEARPTIQTNREPRQPITLVTLGGEVIRRDEVALLRAAELNGIADQLYLANRALDGTGWYDQLGRIVDIQIRCTADGESFTLETDRDEETENNGQAESITVLGTVELGGESTILELPTDLAVRSSYDSQPESAGLLITKKSTISMEELQKLVHWAMYEPGSGDDEDTLDTQEHDFLQAAHYASAKLLLEPDEAEAEIIRFAVNHRIAHLLPTDRSVEIRRAAGSRIVNVRIGNKPAKT